MGYHRAGNSFVSDPLKLMEQMVEMTLGLICRFILDCISLLRGSAIIERFPNERGPNSILP